MSASPVIVPVIMCGGGGTRLWPMSRDTLPKQFLPLFGELSTFQRTAAYFRDRAVFDELIVLTNKDYRFLVADQLAAIGVKASIVLEPMRKDSAAATAVAAELACRRHPDAVVALVAADHVVTGADNFIDTIRRAAAAAAGGAIVTVGIPPSFPATGYGYLSAGAAVAGTADVSQVARFVEKPDARTAAEYLVAGYLWNSGNFIFKAATMLEELEAHQPGIAGPAREAIDSATRDLEFLVLGAEAFGRAVKTSIDYAVMERTTKALMIKANFGWSDVGGWPAMWDLSEKTAEGNAIVGKGYVLDGKNNYVRSESHLTAVVGLDDVIVVTTEDAVLVANRNRADKIKQLVEQMQAQGLREASEHREVFRPWGKYHSVDVGARHQVKRITVKPKGVLSLQKHFHRAEHWVVVQGTAEVTRDHDVLIVNENESVYLPLGCVHRLANPGKIDLQIVEVQVGSYLGEDDIVRIEDLYSRT